MTDPAAARNGADLVLETAQAAGVEVCFANPGTTEMHLVAALDRAPGIRPILGLFEGVATGAADGYGRMTGGPALTLLHLGPGLANGIANLHNARRAHSPVVNLVGDHATWHLAADAPLTSDIAALAGAVGWARAGTDAETLGADTAAAIAAANGPPARPATLVLPQDLTWTPVAALPGSSSPRHPQNPHLSGQVVMVWPSDPRDAVPPPAVPAREVPTVDHELVASASAVLRNGPTTVLLVGGDALHDAGVRATSRIAQTAGCRVFAETFSSRIERGGGLPAIDALPYFPEAAVEALAGAEVAVLVGCADPVAFFGYPDQPSTLLPAACRRIVVADCGMPAAESLWAIADDLGAPAFRPVEVARPAVPSGALSTKTLGAALGATQPEGAIVVNEAATSGGPWTGMAASAPAHDIVGLTGGAIGQGLPCAVGAAVACPDRPVVAFQADGSGLYTAQALWTMAREALDITVVLCANRAYRILQVELHRSGATPGPASAGLMDLANPVVEWTNLAAGFGVPGVQVDTTAALVEQLRVAFAEPGPHLIEVLL